MQAATAYQVDLLRRKVRWGLPGRDSRAFPCATLYCRAANACSCIGRKQIGLALSVLQQQHTAREDCPPPGAAAPSHQGVLFACDATTGEARPVSWHGQNLTSNAEASPHCVPSLVPADAAVPEGSAQQASQENSLTVQEVLEPNEEAASNAVLAAVDYASGGGVGGWPAE